MFRSVFARLLVPYVIILLCALFLQSLLITQLFRNDYYQMVKGKLMDSADDLPVLASEALRKQNNSAELAVLATAMNAIRLKYDATIWLVDRRGIFFFNRIANGSNPNDFSGQKQESLTPEETQAYLEQVLQGQTLVEEGGAFLDRFERPC